MNQRDLAKLRKATSVTDLFPVNPHEKIYNDAASHIKDAVSVLIIVEEEDGIWFNSAVSYERMVYLCEKVKLSLLKDEDG